SGHVPKGGQICRGYRLKIQARLLQHHSLAKPLSFPPSRLPVGFLLRLADATPFFAPIPATGKNNPLYGPLKRKLLLESHFLSSGSGAALMRWAGRSAPASGVTRIRGDFLTFQS